MSLTIRGRQGMSLTEQIVWPVVGGIARALTTSRRGDDTHALAIAYRDSLALAGVTMPGTALSRLSRFWRGLDSLGLSSSLVDGACYRSDNQAASGDTAYSMRGLSNLTLVGDVSRTMGAFATDGATASFGGVIPTESGARTFICPIALQPTAPTEAVDYWSMQSNAERVYFNSLIYTTDNRITYYAGNPVARTKPLLFGADPQFMRVFTRDRDLGYVGGEWVAGSITHGKLTRGETAVTGDFAAVTTLTTTMLYFGARNVSGVWSKHSLAAFPGWLLFSTALSDEELSDVLSLSDSTIWPAWDLILEGDSILYEAENFVLRHNQLWGTNAVRTRLSVAGKHTAAAVANLGTTDGLDASTNLAGSSKKIVVVALGANDVDDPAATTYAKLKTLYSYAKAAGATVVANTIFPNGTLVGDKAAWETNRLALNELIRAGVGVDYDILVDGDQWIYTATETRPVWDDDDIYRVGDDVHLRSGVGYGADLWAAYIAERIAAASFLP
jgi:hypothetical protein